MNTSSCDYQLKVILQSYQNNNSYLIYNKNDDCFYTVGNLSNLNKKEYVTFSREVANKIKKFIQENSPILDQELIKKFDNCLDRQISKLNLQTSRLLRILLVIYHVFNPQSKVRFHQRLATLNQLKETVSVAKVALSKTKIKEGEIKEKRVREEGAEVKVIKETRIEDMMLKHKSRDAKTSSNNDKRSKDDADNKSNSSVHSTHRIKQIEIEFKRKLPSESEEDGLNIRIEEVPIKKDQKKFKQNPSENSPKLAPRQLFTTKSSKKTPLNPANLSPYKNNTSPFKSKNLFPVSPLFLSPSKNSSTPLKTPLSHSNDDSEMLDFPPPPPAPSLTPQKPSQTAQAASSDCKPKLNSNEPDPLIFPMQKYTLLSDEELTQQINDIETYVNGTRLALVNVTEMVNQHLQMKELMNEMSAEYLLKERWFGQCQENFTKLEKGKRENKSVSLFFKNSKISSAEIPFIPTHLAIQGAKKAKALNLHNIAKKCQNPVLHISHAIEQFKLLKDCFELSKNKYMEQIKALVPQHKQLDQKCKENYADYLAQYFNVSKIEKTFDDQKKLEDEDECQVIEYETCYLVSLKRALENKNKNLEEWLEYRASRIKYRDGKHNGKTPIINKSKGKPAVKNSDEKDDRANPSQEESNEIDNKNISFLRKLEFLHDVEIVFKTIDKQGGNILEIAADFQTAFYGMLYDTK